MDDAEHLLGAALHQAEDGGVAAGKTAKGGQAVGQQCGSGEQEADVRHQAAPGACVVKSNLIKRKFAVTIRRLAQVEPPG